MRPNIAGGMQDPRLNRGGPGNPGTVNNTRFPGQSDRVNYYWRNGGPTAGSGQRPDLGRYVPPTMRDGNNWNNRGGYAYNLPNSFGPRPDFGEFNSPYAAMRRRDRMPGDFSGMEDYLSGMRGGRPNFRQMLAHLAEMGGMTAGPYGAGGEASTSGYGGDVVDPNMPTPVAGPKPGQYGKYPPSNGYKGPEMVNPNPMPDMLADPEGFNYRNNQGGMVPDAPQPAMPEFRSQEDFDNWRWGNRRPSYWPQG